MNARTVFPLLALLALSVVSTAQEVPYRPDVWKSAGTHKANQSEIQALINTPGPAILNRLRDRQENILWGTGSPADEAAAHLVEIGTPVIASVLPLLGDKEMWRRRLAVEILGRIGNPHVTPALLTRFDREKDAAVRQSLVESLAMLRDTRTENTLLRVLQDEAPATQRVAAQGLGWLKSKRAITPLVTLMQHNASARSYAAYTLGEIGTPAFPALFDLLTDPTTSSDVLAAAIPPASAVGDRRVVPVLLQFLEDRDEDVRDAAVVAIPKWHDARAIAPLQKILYTRGHTYLSPAGKALAEMGSKEALQVLERAIGDPDCVGNGAALWALHNITTRNALPMLLRLLRTGEPIAQYYAAEALGKLQDARAVPALLKALAGTDEGLRNFAAKALGYFNEARIIDALLLALADPSNDVRVVAIEALRDKHSPRILPAFQRLTKKGALEVRNAAKEGIQIQQKAVQR